MLKPKHASSKITGTEDSPIKPSPVTLVKSQDVKAEQMPISKAHFEVMRAHDGSVSNMISVSGSDESPKLSSEDPLEKELNLTDYEMRVQAANRLGDRLSHHNEQFDEVQRTSYALATDGVSLDLSLKQRRKTEIVSGELFMLTSEVKELKRSMEEHPSGDLNAEEPSDAF